jgi:hypothetical protein
MISLLNCIGRLKHIWSRYSSVNTVTALLDELGIYSRQWENFFLLVAPRPVLGPSETFRQWLLWGGELLPEVLSLPLSST